LEGTREYGNFFLQKEKDMKAKGILAVSRRVVFFTPFCEGHVMRKQSLVFCLVAVIASWAVVSQAATIGLWTFDEKAVGQNGVNGDTVLDSSGSANVHNGTILTDASDVVPYVAGWGSSPALQFERTESYDRIGVAGHADFTYTSSNSYTIETVVNCDYTDWGSSGTTGPLVMNQGTNGGSFMWFDNDLPGKILFSPGFGAKADSEFGGIDTRAKTWSTSNVNDGEWHHIAGVFDGTADEARIYVDGVLEATTSFAAWAGGTSYSGTRGCGAGDTMYFASSGSDNTIREYVGDIDGVAYSNSVLGPGSFVLPEPATLTLLGLGGGLVLLRRRK
jgi:hypothetical protein